MGKPDLIAKALLTARIADLTAHRAAVDIAPEVPLGALTPDAVIRIVRPEDGPLVDLAAPWSLLRAEATVDLKMPGDHLVRSVFARCELRCHARWVMLLERDADRPKDPPVDREEHDHASWIVAPQLPQWLLTRVSTRRARLEPAGQGCWWLQGRTHPMLWVAANELPLREELIPFLIARSGNAFVEFIAWVAPRQGLESVKTLIKELRMTNSALQTLGVEWDSSMSEQERLARADRGAELLLSLIEGHLGRLEETRGKALEEGLKEGRKKGRKEGRKKGLDEGETKGRIDEARRALRRVLARRQLTASPQQERRIDATKNITTLERWHDQAVTAATIDEVFH